MIDTNHEGYAGRGSTMRIPQSKDEAMAALGDLFASTLADPDDEDGCENAAAWLTPGEPDDPAPDVDRVQTLMEQLEASVAAARAKRDGAKAVADGLFRQAFGRNP